MITVKLLQPLKRVVLAAALIGCTVPQPIGAADTAPRDLGRTTVKQIFKDAVPGWMPPDQELHFWFKEELDAYVGVDSTSEWTDEEALEVFAALSRIRTDLPGLYKAIFEESRTGTTRHLSRPKSPPWTNRNVAAVFVIVSSAFQPPDKIAIASNYYSLRPDSDTANAYLNIPFVGLNPAVIRGDVPGLGPSPIYPALTKQAAQAQYFKEGLADTLLHERLHAYITQFYGHERLFAALRAAVPQPPCEYDVEESLVKQLLLETYAQGKHAFSESFLKYWRDDQSSLAAKVRESPCYKQLQQEGLFNGTLLKVDSY